MVLQWRIYYADGSTFDSGRGCPEDAPAWGALIVAQRCADRRNVEVLCGTDYLFHDGTAWRACDWIGLIDRLAHRLPLSALLIGRMVTNGEFNAARARVQSDADFYSLFTAEELADGC